MLLTSNLTKSVIKKYHVSLNYLLIHQINSVAISNKVISMSNVKKSYRAVQNWIDKNQGYRYNSNSIEYRSMFKCLLGEMALKLQWVSQFVLWNMSELVSDMEEAFNIKMH